jgi:hypothetical protein
VSFLRKLVGGASPPPAPTGRILKVGYASGDETMRNWLTQLGKGEWLPFASALMAEPDKRRRDFYIRAAAYSFKDRPGWIQAWPGQNPKAGIPHLLRGVQGIDWAWQARGHLRATETPEKAFETFHKRLEEARKDLAIAAELLPDDAMPWAYQIIVAMGLGASVTDLFWLYGKVRERDPWHPDAAPAMTTALAKKWRGSDEEMFEFVRKVPAIAPDGEPVHWCVAQAHHHIYLDRRSRDYFAEPGVVDEIVAAAAKSIDLLRGDRDPWLLYARAGFALVYLLARQVDRAREEIVELDNVVTGPWLTFDEPAAYWRGARVEVGLDPRPAGA